MKGAGCLRKGNTMSPEGLHQTLTTPDMLNVKTAVLLPLMAHLLAHLNKVIINNEHIL